MTMAEATITLSIEHELTPIKTEVGDLKRRLDALETLRASETIAYSPAQAAALVGVSRRSVDTSIQHGNLVARKMGQRVLISRDSLLSWINSLPLAGG
jgi:excisionase family DNA binding protein